MTEAKSERLFYWSLGVAFGVATMFLVASIQKAHGGDGVGTGRGNRISNTDRAIRLIPRQPLLVVGHGFAIWEHPDGSCELGPDHSGVFIAGPRRNWWPDQPRKGLRQ